MAEKTRVLAVDDNRDTLDLLSHLLGNEGYQVETESDASVLASRLPEALDSVSLVISDWQMPTMNGIELLQKIKSYPRFVALPVVMLTAKSDPESIRQGIHYGAFYYLTKPVQPDLLSAIVASAARASERHADLLEQIDYATTPLRLIEQATFKIQTFSEARQLARNLGIICQQPQVAALALDELLTNGIEHGNLGISMNEKTELIRSGKYYAELLKRLSIAPYSNRHVTMTMTRQESRYLDILITDEGAGFDFKKQQENKELDVFKPNGRGIMILQNSNLADFQYIEPGNKVKFRLSLAE